MCSSLINLDFIFLIISLVLIFLLILSFKYKIFKEYKYKRAFRIILLTLIIFFLIKLFVGQQFSTTCGKIEDSPLIYQCHHSNPIISKDYFNYSVEFECKENQEKIFGIKNIILENGSIQICCGIPKNQSN